MSTHSFLDDDLRDRAAQYALGGLDEREARLVRVHLAECAACRAEVEEVTALARQVLEAAPPRQPPPGVWSRILDRIRSRALPPGAEAPARVSSPVARTLSSARERRPSESFAFLSASEGSWVATGVPGVEVRHLHADPSADRMTFLVRMAPGSAYPRHRHAGAEECFVIQGDLTVGDKVMGSGDFQLATSGSVHTVQSTREGCLLLISCSLNDELLP